MPEFRMIDHLVGLRGERIPLLSSLQERDYQVRVVDKVSNYFYHDGITSAMIESATGSGKTVMGLQILKKFESVDDGSWRDEGYDALCGWMTMRRTNLTQAAAANNAVFGVENLRYISMFDKSPPKVKILVSDEAQHDAASSSTTVHTISEPKLILGLSATPFRTDRLSLTFQKTVRDSGIHRLIQDGWLSKFNHHTIDKYDVPSVTQAYLRDRERWGKTAVYWHRIDDCRAFARNLQRAGVQAIVVDGSTKNVEDVLAAFDAGVFPVLTSVAKLTEGFDCPSLQTVFVRDSSKLPCIQMCGRVLRICEGKTHANIVQSTKSKWQFPKTATPHKSFVWRPDGWRSLGSSKTVNRVCRSNVRLLAKAPPVVLPKILQEKERQKDRFGFNLEGM